MNQSPEAVGDVWIGWDAASAIGEVDHIHN